MSTVQTRTVPWDLVSWGHARRGGKNRHAEERPSAVYQPDLLLIMDKNNNIPNLSVCTLGYNVGFT